MGKVPGWAIALLTLGIGLLCGAAYGQTASSATVLEVVQSGSVKTPVTVSIASSENPARLNDMVKFAISVQAAPGEAQPTGTVTLEVCTDGTTTCTSNQWITAFSDAPLTEGKTECVIPASKVGQFPVRAVYNGDPSHF